MSLAAWQAGGIASRELGYYSALSRHVGPIEFLSYGKAEDEAPILDGYPTLSVRCVPFAPRLGRYTKLSKTLYGPFLLRRTNGYRLVRSNQFDGGWAASLAAWRLAVPFVLRCGYVYSQHYAKRRTGSDRKIALVRRLEGMIARRADAVIVTYGSARQFFIDVHRVDPEKIHVIGNSIDLDLFSDATSPAPMADVVCVARHEPQKNLPALIHACGALGLSLSLVGSGQLTEELRRQAALARADVRFLGQLPNQGLPAVLRAHKVFAFPSHYEGNPKAVLEAMAAMVPVVASDIPQHRDVIDDGVHGLLCATDSDAIAGTLERAIEDAGLRARLVVAARARVMREYSCAANAAREASLHASLQSGVRA